MFIMSKIIVSNNYSKIVEENDTEFLTHLDNHLSFKYVGAEFTPAFKSYNWNGREYLLSKKLVFMTGLVNYVKDFYIKYNKELEIIDHRKLFKFDNSIDLSENLNKLNIIPYDYQLAAVENASKHDRMIFKHATGSGKTVISAIITAKFNKPTAIYVISKDLLYQFHSFFSKLFNEKIGIIGDKFCDIQRISIISIQTAGRALGMKKNEILIDDETDTEKYNDDNKEDILNFLKTSEVHIFDECHCCAAKTVRNIYKIITPYKLFGLSGTPVRDDGADLLLTGIFGDIVHEISASELIKRKVLAKPFIKFNYIKGNSKFNDKYPTVYSDNIVNNNYRNNIIVNEAKNLLSKGYVILVLFKTIKHGKILCDLFQSKNIDCEFLTGNDAAKVRNNAKNNILLGKSNCIIASQIFDLGIDIPNLNALILAGSGKSSVKTLQRIGRVIRDGKNKSFAAVVEFFDDVRYLKGHTKRRIEIYKTEPEFDIKLPQNIKI